MPARRGQAPDPVKRVHFTGEDRRRVANLIELTAILRGIPVASLMERYIREALERDPVASGLRSAAGPSPEDVHA